MSEQQKPHWAGQMQSYLVVDNHDVGSMYVGGQYVDTSQ